MSFNTEARPTHQNTSLLLSTIRVPHKKHTTTPKRYYETQYHYSPWLPWWPQCLSCKMVFRFVYFFHWTRTEAHMHTSTHLHAVWNLSIELVRPVAYICIAHSQLIYKLKLLEQHLEYKKKTLFKRNSPSVKYVYVKNWTCAGCCQIRSTAQVLIRLLLRYMNW